MTTWQWILRRATLFIITGPSEHLHVVMNDPVLDPVMGVDAVLLVNVCSIKTGMIHDTTCVLQPGSHPFISRPSYVDYYHAVVKRAQPLEDGVQTGALRAGAATDEALYASIRTGFLTTPDIPQQGAVMRFFRQHNI
jgi:hypothetical protein